MKAISFGRKGSYVLPLFQLGLFFFLNFSFMAFDARAAMRPRKPYLDSDKVTIPGCNATFFQSPQCPSGLTISVSIADCAGPPKVSVACYQLFEGVIDLGVVLVFREDGTVYSRWRVRWVSGVVEVELLDLP